MGVIEAIAAAVVVQLGKKVLGHEDLVESVGGAVGKAAGKSIGDRVTRVFSDREHKAVLETALKETLSAVEKQHLRFVRASGGFSWEFLSSDTAAGELARAFINGQSPNVAELVGTWSKWITSVGSESDVDKRQAMAIEPMRTLVGEWTTRVRALEPGLVVWIFVESLGPSSPRQFLRRTKSGSTANEACAVALTVGREDAELAEEVRTRPYLGRIPGPVPEGAAADCYTAEWSAGSGCIGHRTSPTDLATRSAVGNI